MLYVKGFLVALQGVPVTVGVTLIAMVTGVVLGLVLALLPFARVGMWLFYLPSQVLLTLSAGKLCD